MGNQPGLIEALARVAREYGSAERLASVIEHTMLSPNKGVKEAMRIVDESSSYGFACAVLTPYHATKVAGYARDKGVELCAVIGFPGGFQPVSAKRAEIMHVASLVSGVDIVANIQALVDGDPGVAEELGELVDYAREAGVGHVKIIVEAPLLDDEALARAVEAVAEAGADYVKTSTGVYSKGGDPVTVLRTFQHAEGYGLKVKAAGGIRTALDALLALAAGAARLGTSSGPRVVETLERLTG